MLAELERAWLELDADPDVRVIVNTGNGSAFQTGLDVVQLSRTATPCASSPAAPRDAELRFTAWHNQVWKPVIAAVNGVCAGGGLHFVADADIVIAASNATFLDPHVSIGQVTAYEDIALVRKSPVESILRMALVGRHERLTAERAYQLGILSQVVDPPERLEAEAQELAEKIARNSPAAMARHQAGAVGRARDGPHRRLPGRRQRARRRCGATPTRPRAPLAFAEKRDAALASRSP